MEKEMTGYATEDRYWASRYTQGERTVYSLDLALSTVAATMPRPNPETPAAGNRRVSEPHARSFGRYVRDNQRWVAPGLLLRAPDVFNFEVKEEIAGSQFGVLGLPRLVRTDLKILDGQHRILGLCYAVEDLAAELEANRNQLAEARRQQNAALEQQFRAHGKALDEQRARLDRERISVEIHIEDDTKRVQQMFVDIADNLKGINFAIRTRFDYRKVVNRALDDILKHPLLKGRVDLELDRIVGSNPNLMGAKHVADITRTLAVGLGSRIGRRQESELDEVRLVDTANRFFNVLVDSFPQLKTVIDGKSSPEKLRKESLLASSTMLRVFAGVFYELNVKGRGSDGDIKEFFSKLAPTMTAPIRKDSPWMKTGVFTAGAMAPTTAGQRDVNALMRAIIRWAKDGPKSLEAA